MTTDAWALHTQIIHLNGSCAWEIYKNKSSWSSSTTDGTSRKRVNSLTDYQNSKHDIILIAHVVVNHRISVFPVSSDYNRIRGQ